MKARREIEPRIAIIQMQPTIVKDIIAPVVNLIGKKWAYFTIIFSYS